MRKEISAWGLIDDPDILPVARVCTHVTIAYKQLGALVKPGGDSGKDPMKMRRVDRLIEVIPMDCRGGDLIF
jgi:hypothetical protein